MILFQTSPYRDSNMAVIHPMLVPSICFPDQISFCQPPTNAEQCIYIPYNSTRPWPWNKTLKCASQTITSQQLQVPRDLVHGALGGGPDAEDGQAARVDLGAAGVGDDLGGDAERSGLGQQLVQLVGALGLQGNLGLPVALPALQQPGRGAAGPGGARRLGDGLEAREGRVAALRCDLAWKTNYNISIGLVLRVRRWAGWSAGRSAHPWSCPDLS